MEYRIIIVMLLTFVITYIGTLAYSVRIVGVRTGKIAISFALFNILVLVSRTANMIQVPILTNYVEKNQNISIVNSFYAIILSAGFATIVGSISIPSFQRVFSKAVNRFSEERSIGKVVYSGLSKNGMKQLSKCIVLPSNVIKQIRNQKLYSKIVIFNIIAVALLVVGSLAPIYAGVLEPSLRATSLSLSGVINGFATIFLFVLIDPYLSIKTDDAIEGKCSESEFRKNVIGMVGGKIIGTFIAIPILVPSAKIIVMVAKLL